ALAIINGLIYVADTGGGTANLVEVNPTTGQQRLVTSDNNLITPAGLVPAPNGNVYWADQSSLGNGAIYLINTQTGAQSYIASNSFFNHIVGMSQDASGNLIVINQGNGSGGSVL